MTPDKSIEERIRDEAEEKYPVFSGFTSSGLPHEIYTGQKYKREGYIAGRSKSIEAEKQKDERIRELEEGLRFIRTKCNISDNVSFLIDKLLNNK